MRSSGSPRDVPLSRRFERDPSAPVLDRRTVLRGVGAALALPWLEAFLPRRAIAADAARPPVRLAFVYAPNGVSPRAWHPEPGIDRASPLPPSLEPLAPVRDHVLIARGLGQDWANAHGDGPGDHARAAAVFLTSRKAVKTAGAGISVGTSIDQVAARALAEATRVPSIELGLERGGRAGSCDSGYACAYSNHVSWSDPATPNAKEIDPRRIFERLFGAGPASSEPGAVRRSILDRTADDTRRLIARLGRADRERLGGWLEGVRETERRIERAERFDQEVRERLGDRAPPSGIPARHPDHARLVAELIVLAFRTDATRVVTHMLGNGGSNRVYSFLGLSEGHHGLSHHQGDEAKIGAIERIDRWLVEEFAWLVAELAATPEGDGSLLDRTALVFGSGIRDGNRHDHHDLPLLVAGRAGGAIMPGRVVAWPRGTPLANLWLSLLDAVGAGEGIERFGDSTGRLVGLAAP